MLKVKGGKCRMKGSPVHIMADAVIALKAILDYFIENEGRERAMLHLATIFNLAGMSESEIDEANAKLNEIMNSEL